MDAKRTINRAIFESSLELKCLMFFCLGLLVIITVSFFLYWEVTGAQIRTQNPRMANLLVVQHLTFKHWAEFQKAGESGRNDGTPDEFVQYMEDMNHRLRNLEYQSNFIWHPDTFFYDTMILGGSEKRSSPNPEERKIFETHFKDDYYLEDYDAKNAPLEYYDYEGDDGVYHYYQVVRGDHYCNTECHPLQPGLILDSGAMLGLVHIEIPKPPSNKDAMAKYWAMLLGGAIITAFLSLMAFDLIIRWVVISPLRKLRNVTEGISRGDLSKRADLHTGDEFESLGEAFNRMLRKMVSAQEKLRSANTELESKVDELAHLSIQLYETNRLKSDFMATMSHELRTPLNSILGFSDVLGSIESLDDKQKRYVGNINKSGRTLLNMINDILDMAKMEAGRMSVSLSTFNIPHIVTAQCDMAKPLIDRKNLELQVVIDPELPPMHQDESRIQQILNNLLSNAIKFTPEGGRIKLTVRKTEATAPLVSPPQGDPMSTGRITGITPKSFPVLEMEVADNGLGISEDDRQLIFEKFRQGTGISPEGDAIKREYSGTGLGLSIVKEICKMLEGSISLESQIGLGSTFTVRLPWNLEEKNNADSELANQYQDFSKNRILKLAQKPK